MSSPKWCPFCLGLNVLRMYRAMWDRMHEGATRITYVSVHLRIRVAPECLRSHNTRYIMHKSDYDIYYLVLIHYEAEICEVPKREVAKHAWQKIYALLCRSRA